jgi:signal transduction histidine kinase
MTDTRPRRASSGSALDAMTRFRVPPLPRLRPVVSYALALLLPVVALAGEEALRAWVQPIPFVLFFFVVSLASPLGGWGPGFVSVVVSGICGWLFLWTSPVPEVAAGALLGALVFVPVASVIAALGALVRAGLQERETAALQLAEAVRSRDEFISTASHELKTPLTSLLLVAQQLSRRPRGATGEDPSVPRHLQSVQRQVSRLTLLVNNLLDVSRIRSGRMYLALEEVDLLRAVEEVLAQFEDEIGRTGSSVTVQASGPVVGRWDRFRVEQIVTNLLSNAVKYGAGTPIAIAVRRDPDGAVLTVANGGAGIAPEDQDRIFERFARGPHGNAPGGFGVGLWIVREIVTALGGTVRVASAPDQGATFTVALPVSSPVADEPRR